MHGSEMRHAGCRMQVTYCAYCAYLPIPNLMPRQVTYLSYARKDWEVSRPSARATAVEGKSSIVTSGQSH